MSTRMGTFLLIFILIGALYICAQLFPTFFGITQGDTPPQNNTLLTNEKATITPESAMGYILVACGANCENCENSLSNCSQLIIDQTAFFCKNGQKGGSVCYYDFESLSNACQKLCKK